MTNNARSTRGWMVAAAGLALMGASALPQGAAADEARVLPFFSKPYPYGYAGGHLTCEVLRPIETPDGIQYERVWVCDHVVRARY